MTVIKYFTTLIRYDSIVIFYSSHSSRFHFLSSINPNIILLVINNIRLHSKVRICLDSFELDTPQSLKKPTDMRLEIPTSKPNQNKNVFKQKNTKKRRKHKQKGHQKWWNVNDYSLVIYSLSLIHSWIEFFIYWSTDEEKKVFAFNLFVKLSLLYHSNDWKAYPIGCKLRCTLGRYIDEIFKKVKS